jgi:hypothetical protein
MGIQIGNTKIDALMYADDLIIIRSQSSTSTTSPENYNQVWKRKLYKIQC